MRTAGEDASDDEFSADMSQLVELWSEYAHTRAT